MKEQPFEQTRRHRRFVVDEMDIRGMATAPGEAGPVPFSVLTLSLGGMLIKTLGHHLTGTILHMEVTLPGAVRLSFNSSVTSWVQAGDGHYETGIRFQDLSDRDKTSLKEFIRGLYLQDAGFDG
jgi:hypothetical protein